MNPLNQTCYRVRIQVSEMYYVCTYGTHRNVKIKKVNFLEPIGFGRHNKRHYTSVAFGITVFVPEPLC